MELENALLKLEPNSIYALEHENEYTREQICALQLLLGNASAATGIKFLILPAGTRIARDK